MWQEQGFEPYDIGIVANPMAIAQTHAIHGAHRLRLLAQRMEVRNNLLFVRDGYVESAWMFAGN